MNEKKNIILAYGNKEFNNSLNELKDYLSFDLRVSDKLENVNDTDSYKGFLIHEDALKDRNTKDLLENNKKKQNYYLPD